MTSDRDVFVLRNNGEFVNLFSNRKLAERFCIEYGLKPKEISIHSYPVISKDTVLLNRKGNLGIKLGDKK